MINVIQKKQKIGIVKKQDTLGNQVNYAYLALGSNLGKKIINLELAKYQLYKNEFLKNSSQNYFLIILSIFPKQENHLTMKNERQMMV